MSLEACPFCGKSYKRLKSHLPHCKAAPKPSSTHRDPAASQTPDRLAADLSKKKGAESKKKVPENSVTPTPPLSSTSKKKKASEPTSPASKPKKKSAEAAKPSQGLQSQRQRSAQPEATSASKKKEAERVDLGEDKRDVLGKETLKESGSLSRITLQHVGSTLGRAKSSRPTIHIQTNGPEPKRSHASVSLAAPKQASSEAMLISQASQATPPPHTVDSLNVGLRHRPRLPSASLGHFQGLPSGAEDALMSRKQTDNSSGRGLGQVTLRELPCWLACRTPSRPTDVVEMMQRGWGWYYRKYFHVRKGGIGGVAMLLAGYCVLSYVWSYPHLKRDRWRKYH
ncbi:uncharacterized protein C17orf80 homolog isoform X2 [Entelurus aequoreus]|uniref:uncharacterized protein C17orf80 homolog isoform X2 n=1 Tax=Entelurus aequoreus TaxID=161455 RepID=UPI002B1DF14E|nr:uncharacterized protein C17orf80 homolog isoform X2 [Entelurus aequoreus]